jgi:succinate dehydrogenase flavin-adding protein (antitoxin of CptAB toxin-antitoxin module)
VEEMNEEKLKEIVERIAWRGHRRGFIKYDEFERFFLPNIVEMGVREIKRLMENGDEDHD